MNAKHTQHTQGPWQVLHDASVVGPDEVQEDGGIHVQSIARMALCQELMANARLIAAAPELLEALETAQMALIGYTHQNDITRNAMVKICAAIAKAKVGA